MSKAVAYKIPSNVLARFFSKDAPATWHYAIWYGFLFLWMQGEALLNIFWVLLLLISLPYVPFAIERLKPYRWLWISIATYLLLRLISLSYAVDQKAALYGITDDLRIFTVGLLALIYLRSADDLKRGLIATLSGFGVLAWHSLWLHWTTYHSLQPNSNVEFGSLAHVNYAAAFSSTILLCLLATARHTSHRWLYAISAVAIPLAIIQAPLGSRTTLIIFAITVILFLLLKRPGVIVGAVAFSLFLTIGITLKQTTNGMNQFTEFTEIEHPADHASIYIRVDIWKFFLHNWQNHPLGIGPKGFNTIDLNTHRQWIAGNIPRTAGLFYGEEALQQKLTGVDLNKHHIVTDPHSHYVSLLAEVGLAGLLAFISYLIAAFTIAIRHLKVSNNWISGTGEAAAGGIFLLGGCAIMTAVFYQSGGIITVMLIAFLLASIDIHGIEKEETAAE